jgi:hypothetical protein
LWYKAEVRRPYFLSSDCVGSDVDHCLCAVSCVSFDHAIATSGLVVVIRVLVVVIRVLVARGRVQVDIEVVNGLKTRILWISTLSGSHELHVDLQGIVSAHVLSHVPSEVGCIKRRWELDLDIDVLSALFLLETSSRQDELLHHALLPLHHLVVHRNVEFGHSSASLTIREVWSLTVNSQHVSVTKREVVGVLLSIVDRWISSAASSSWCVGASAATR